RARIAHELRRASCGGPEREALCGLSRRSTAAPRQAVDPAEVAACSNAAKRQRSSSTRPDGVVPCETRTSTLRLAIASVRRLARAIITAPGVAGVWVPAGATKPLHVATGPVVAARVRPTR